MILNTTRVHVKLIVQKSNFEKMNFQRV